MIVSYNDKKLLRKYLIITDFLKTLRDLSLIKESITASLVVNFMYQHAEKHIGDNNEDVFR